MNAIVIYNSKRGSTKKYADWISEELDCLSVPFSALDKSGGFSDESGAAHNIDEYDAIVYGGWLRGSGIVGYDKFKVIAAGLEEKTILFAVGISEYNPQNYMQICEINFPETADGKIDMSAVKLFYCPGAYDSNKVKGLDGMMMWFAKRVLLAGKTSDGIGAANKMADAIENGADFSDRKYIDPIVRAALKKADKQ